MGNNDMMEKEEIFFKSFKSWKTHLFFWCKSY